MKRFSLPLSLFALCSCLTWAASTGPNDEFFEIYNLIQQADRLNESGSKEMAQERYNQALDSLMEFSRIYPTWNKEIVGFRIRYLEDRITSAPKKPDAGGDGVSKALDSREVTDLKGKIARLESANTDLRSQITVLEAKLNEALSARPSNVDPEELRRAQNQIRMLEQEKQLLQTALNEARNTDKTPNAPPVHSQSVIQDLERTQQELAAANRKVVEQSAAIARLLEQRNTDVASSDSVATSGATPALSDTNLRLAQQEARIQTLETENKNLKENLDKLGGSSDKDALMARVKELQEKLNKANEALYNNEMHVKLAQIETLTNQLAILRTKLNVYEARKEPFTEEELALIKSARPEVPQTIPSAGSSQAGLNQLPAGSAPFAEAARRAYASGRLESAEENYRRILALDENNIYSLNNLGIVLVEQNKYEEAEAVLEKALQLAPNDSKTLGIMGVLKFRTQAYDESFEYLSKAAKSDPDNAETQNYLGILLNQKGQRDSAEAALRKAVKINPNYANAHFNLAITYATQKPPYLELARWHYNKSVALGHEPDPRVEEYFKNM